MEEGQTSVNAVIGAEVKHAVYEAGFNVKTASEAAGLSYRTVLRYISGERDMPVPVLLALMYVTGADLPRLSERLHLKIQTRELLGELGGTTVSGLPGAVQVPRAEFKRRLEVVLEARGIDPANSYASIAEALSHSGVSISEHDWGLLMDAQVSAAPHVELLFSVAEALSIDPDYLLQDDPALIDVAEARLSFDRQMRVLGVARVAARSLGTIGADELRGIADVVTEIVTELRVA